MGIGLLLFGLAGSSCGGGADAGPTGPATGGAATTIAISTGNAQSSVAGAATGTAPSVIVTNGTGGGVAGVSVTFTVATGGGSVTGGTQTTNASGIATVGSWILGATAGANTMTVTSTGLTGSPVTFSATGTAGPAATVVVNAGNGQTAVAGAATAIAPSVKVSDANGNLVAGASVTYAIASGAGSITGATASSSAAGIATVGSWTLGTVAGANTLTATVTGIAPVVFTATGSAGAATQIAVNAGNAQTALAAAAVAVLPSVVVKDANGNAVSGTSVTFAVASGGGVLTGGSAATNASGIATVGSWTLGAAAGANTLTASVTGLTGSPVTFTATSTAGPATSLAYISGPVAGVAGVIGTPAVVIQARDAGNLLATTFTGNVTLAISNNPGGSTLGGTTTVAAVAGVATFANITLNKTGVGYTVSASSGALTAATSPAITITPAAAASLSLVGGNAQTAAAATVLPTPLTVKVTDAFGNAVPGTTVNFAIAAGGGSVTPTAPVSDANGQAASVWTLGATLGAQSVSATSVGLTGSPVAFSANGASSSLRTWTGATSTAWATTTIWSPAGVPVATDSVVIPATTNLPTLAAVSTIKALTVARNAVLTLGCFNLTVNGSVDASGAIAGCGPVVLASPTAATVNGTIGTPVQVTGSYSVTGALTATGLQIQGAGSVDINGQAVAVGANGISTAGSATLTMTQASGALATSGGATFAGGSETGRLTNGILSVGGDFTQSTTATAFIASGSHTVVLNGTGTQTVTFANPGVLYDASCPGSCFANLTVNKASGSVTVASKVKVLGAFTNSSSAAITTPSTNGSFIVAGNASFGQNGTFHRVGVGTSTYSKSAGTSVDSVSYFGTSQSYLPAVLNDSYSEIIGSVTWGAPGTHTGNMMVLGTGQMNVSTAGALLTGTFRTSASGTLRMNTNATDSLVIGDTVTFTGGSTTGLITAGTLIVRGNITVIGNAFDASGTHTTVLNSTSFKTLAWGSAPGGVGYNNLVFDSVGHKNFSGNQLIKGNILITAISGTVDGAYVIGWSGSTLTDVSGTSPSKWQPGLWQIRGAPTAMPTNYIINTIQLIGGATMTLSSNLIANYITVDSSSKLILNGHFVSCQGNYFTTQNGGTLQMTSVGDSLEANQLFFNGGSTVGLLTKGGIFVTGPVFGILYQGFDAARGVIANAATTSFAASGTRVYFAPSFGQNVAFRNPGTGVTGSHFGTVQSKLNGGVVNVLTNVFVDSLFVGEQTGAIWQSDSSTHGVVRTITTNGISNTGTFGLAMQGVNVVLNDGPTAATFNAVTWTAFPASYTGALFTTTRNLSANPSLNNHVYTAVTFGVGGQFIANTGALNLVLGSGNNPATCTGTFATGQSCH